jgi:hypothetical protein
MGIGDEAGVEFNLHARVRARSWEAGREMVYGICVGYFHVDDNQATDWYSSCTPINTMNVICTVLRL